MDWGQLWLGLGLAIPATALGVMAYLRSKQVDAVSEKSGAVTENRAGIAQIQAALENFTETLQEDNIQIRLQVKYLTERLDTAIAERDNLKLELARLRRKYGENGDALGGNGTRLSHEGP